MFLLFISTTALPTFSPRLNKQNPFPLANISELFLLLLVITLRRSARAALRSRRWKGDPHTLDGYPWLVITINVKRTSPFTAQKSLNSISPPEWPREGSGRKKCFTLKNTDGAWWRIGHKTINVFPSIDSGLPDDVGCEAGKRWSAATLGSK